MIHQDEISFEFGDYWVIYTFITNVDEKEDEEDDDEYFSFNTINSSADIDEFIEKDFQIESYKIRGYEFLGWRNDTEDCRSITNEMFYIYKQIKSFNNQIVALYSTDIDYGDYMCDNDGNYIFEIQLDVDISKDLNFSIYISQLLGAIDTDIPSFYNVFFGNRHVIGDSKNLKILSTNTKVRRLGYFKILSQFMNDFKKIPSTKINSKFEDYCLVYKDVLQDSIFKKGLIDKSKTGISAKPYIETSTDLGFLNKINNLFHAGKIFKVYQALEKSYTKSTDVFILSEFDKLFFLEQILRHDYFYFSTLLELFFIEQDASYTYLIENFQAKIIDKLELYKNSVLHSDRKIYNNFDSIYKRINSWEKPGIYLEHLLMPRINWMLDLELISGNNFKYVISDKGLKLFKHLMVWNDINTEEIVSPDSFLDRFIIHVFDDCYNEGTIYNPNDRGLITKEIYKHINDSFELFKTLAPNRVTASQAIMYAKYKLYLDDNIKVGYQYILNKLSDKDQEIFIFKYQSQYQDGYIQKKN